MKQNVILEKSKAFGVRITNLHHYLEKEKKEYTISKQIYKSGTSIGANISEAVKAESKKRFYT